MDFVPTKRHMQVLATGDSVGRPHSVQAVGPGGVISMDLSDEEVRELRDRLNWLYPKDED